MEHTDTTGTDTENALRDAAGQADARTPDPAPAADDAAPLPPPASPAAGGAGGGSPEPDSPPLPAAPAAAAAGEDRREIARLREEVSRTKAEVARLTQLTSLYGGSGGGSPPAAARRFDELNEREMEAELRRQARGLDGF